MVYFEKIEVVNQLSEAFVINTTRRFGLEYDKNLIFDKVHHEINQLCSRSTLQAPFPLRRIAALLQMCDRVAGGFYRPL